MNRRTFLQAASAGTTALVLPASASNLGGGGCIGDAPEGQTAFEFLGRSDQNVTLVTHYGYLTHVFGLTDDLLFSSPTVRTEATALFTFAAATTWDSRHEYGNIITTSAPGEMSIYLRDTPGANFANPASFAIGAVIATYSVRYFNVLNVQAPNQGVIATTVELTQRKTKPLAQGHQRCQFGRVGLRARISANGEGTRTVVAPVQAVFLVGGTVVVTDR